MEIFTQSKSGVESENEDSYHIDDEVVAIFDGVTDQNNSAYPKPGRRAAVKLAEAASDTKGLSPIEMVAYLHSVLPSDGSEVAVGAVLHIPSQIIVRVGDISIGINSVFDVPAKNVDTMCANLRSMLLNYVFNMGYTVDHLRQNDYGRKMIAPFLKHQTMWRNDGKSSFGFAAFDGCGTPSNLVDVVKIPNNAEVILATDGYYDPKPTLHESEEALIRGIKEDPLCINLLKGVKGILPDNLSFDDRTYIRLKI